MLILGLFTCGIQALIFFTTLTATYTDESMEGITELTSFQNSLFFLG
jgi:hypothetical protein